jgi:hypothetical protein
MVRENFREQSCHITPKITVQSLTIRSTGLDDLSSHLLSNGWVISGDNLNGTGDVTYKDRLKESLSATKYGKKWQKAGQLGEPLCSQQSVRLEVKIRYFGPAH